MVEENSLVFLKKWKVDKAPTGLYRVMRLYGGKSGDVSSRYWVNKRVRLADGEPGEIVNFDFLIDAVKEIRNEVDGAFADIHFSSEVVKYFKSIGFDKSRFELTVGNPVDNWW